MARLKSINSEISLSFLQINKIVPPVLKLGLNIVRYIHEGFMKKLFVFHTQTKISIGLFLFISIIPLSMVFSQKSYVTPIGQYIKIFEGGTSWDYIEKPTSPSSNFTDNLFSLRNKYDSILFNQYYNEADGYAKYIVTKFENDQKELISKELRDLEKSYLQSSKAAAENIKKLLAIPQNSSSLSLNQILDEVKNEENEFKHSDLITNIQVPGKKDDKNQQSDDEKAKIITKLTETSETLTDSKDSIRSQKNLDTFTFELDKRNERELLQKIYCQLIYDDFDEKLNKNRKETVTHQLFNYTHPKLTNHFKNNDFLIGEASLIKTDNAYFINLKITIRSKDARRSYGYIEQGAMLRISLVSGKKLFLENRIVSSGKLEAFTGNTIYQCFYGLDKDQVEDLYKNELDKIGLMWTTGFEDYPVYQIDFFQQLIECLNNETKSEE